MAYLYQNEEWPHFRWNPDPLLPELSAVRYRQGLLLGKMLELASPLRKQAALEALTEETVKSSAIEGKS